MQVFKGELSSSDSSGSNIPERFDFQDQWSSSGSDSDSSGGIGNNMEDSDDEDYDEDDDQSNFEEMLARLQAGAGGVHFS